MRKAEDAGAEKDEVRGDEIRDRGLVLDKICDIYSSKEQRKERQMN